MQIGLNSKIIAEFPRLVQKMEVGGSHPVNARGHTLFEAFSGLNVILTYVGESIFFGDMLRSCIG